MPDESANDFKELEYRLKIAECTLMRMTIELVVHREVLYGFGMKDDATIDGKSVRNYVEDRVTREFDAVLAEMADFDPNIASEISRKFARPERPDSD